MSNLNDSYLVLARKYRSQNFDDMVGQDVLVKTLRNAINTGRVAHAYILTGIRGVGKTSTARILAKAFNCVGKDGKATSPQATPCGECENCKAIAEGRHVDVLELDAASKNGVDDIREIIEGAQYKPNLGRYKVYIIDEVHMLSKPAFNALLKTLEEPPEHVKFIFATTEIRKVLPTILSRCQRFDLVRIEVATLIEHFKNILKQEKITFEDEAIKLIAQAADGSARDGLSLLDQAIVLGEGKVQTQNVASMLGLLDRRKTFELFDYIAQGNLEKSFEIIKNAYALGTNVTTVLKDLMDVVYFILRFKAAPKSDMNLLEEERNYLEKFNKLDIAYLTLVWQILLKGMGEISLAPSEIKALEVILIKMVYAQNLPSLEDMLKRGDEVKTQACLTPSPTIKVAAPQGGKYTSPQNLEEVVKILEAEREMILACLVKDNARLISFAEGKIEINFDENSPENLHTKMTNILSKALGCVWQVLKVEGQGQETLSTKNKAASEKLMDKARQNENVKDILNVFAGAKLTKVHKENKNAIDEDSETEGE